MIAGIECLCCAAEVQQRADLLQCKKKNGPVHTGPLTYM
jgi:hypothetical protein